MTTKQRKALLRAEARAWRQLAESFAEKPYGLTFADRITASHATWGVMALRLGWHRDAMIGTTPREEWYNATPDDEVLAALFLALECDDEASAL